MDKDLTDTLLEGMKIPEGEEPQYRFKPLTIEDAFNMPPVEMLVEGLIGRGWIGQLYAQPNLAKTGLVLELAFCAIEGCIFGEDFHIPKPLNIIYMAGEGAQGIAARIRTMVAEHGTNREAYPRFTWFEVLVQLFADVDGVGVDRFIADIKDQGIAVDLLIIDTQHLATIGAEEKDAKDAGTIIRALRRIRDALNCSILLLHHPTKTGESDRGSGAIRAALDFQWEIVGEATSTKTFRCTKQRDLRYFDPINFDIEEVGESVVIKWMGKQRPRPKETIGCRITALLSAHVERLIAEEIAENIGAKLGSAKNELTKLVSAGRVESRKREGTNAFEYWHPDHFQTPSGGGDSA